MDLFNAEILDNGYNKIFDSEPSADESVEDGIPQSFLAMFGKCLENEFPLTDVFGINDVVN